MKKLLFCLLLVIPLSAQQQKFNPFTKKFDYLSPLGAGSGTITGGTNAGSGASVFYQASGASLQFNGILSTNTPISVVLNGTTHNVELTFNATNVNLTDLNGDLAQSRITGLVAALATKDAILTFSGPLSRSVDTISILQQMSVTSDVSGLKLVNDETSPTDGKFYGKVGGVKGWFTPSGGGSGITTFNTLTSLTQTLAIGTSGTSPTWSSITSTHTLNIPMASSAGVTAGLLSRSDYDLFNAKVSSSRQIICGSTLTGCGDFSADRTIGVVNDTSQQRVGFYKAGVLVATRQSFNIIDGANVTTSVVDNPGANRVDITINSSGGSGGSGTANTFLAFSSQTTSTLTGATHGYGHKNLLIDCYDSTGQWVDPNTKFIHPTTFDVTVTFTTAFTGRCSINGSGGGSGTTLTAGNGVNIIGNAIVSDPTVVPELATQNTYSNMNDFSGGFLRLPIGSGAPSSSTCNASNHLGSKYTRSDVSTNPEYVCAQTSTGVYGWVQPTSGGGSSSGLSTISLALHVPGNGTQLNTSNVVDMAGSVTGDVLNGTLAATAAFPASGSPSPSVTIRAGRLPATWGGTVGVGLRNTAKDGGSGAGRYLVQAQCKADAEATTSFSFSGSTTTIPLSITTGFWNVASVTSVDLTGSGCSAGEYLYLKVQRDNTVASNYGFAAHMSEVIVDYGSSGGGGGAGGSIPIQDNGGSSIGTAATLRLGNGTGMSWVITDLGGGVIRATPNVDTTGLATLTGTQTLTNKTLGSGTTFTHASQHQNGGSDEVATATPGANAIPKADGTGKLAAGWLPSSLGFAFAGNAGGGTVAASTTNYVSPTGTISGTESFREVIMPEACTARDLHLITSATQSATGSYVVTLRKNGADTAVTLTVAAGAAAGTFTDTSNSVSFAKGDRADLALQNNATSGSTGLRAFSWRCN